MGPFITFEGIEGCGKTTQAEMLKGYLKRKGISVILTREPGGTRLGERIRGILLGEEGTELTPWAELLLYLACRAQIVEKVIRPALASNFIVICDRFSDSTLAYQGYGKGLPLEIIKSLDKWVTGGLKPDKTFLLDCSVKEGLRRAWVRINSEEKGEDRFEKEGIEFHERVREGYLKIATETKRVKVISANREASLIHEEICVIIDKLLESK